MSRVLVVGAGVVGLTCAVRLLEAGHRVDVRRPGPAAGDDVGRRGGVLVPLPGAARRTRSRPGRRRRTPSSTRWPTPTRSPGWRWSRAPRSSSSREPDPWWRSAVPSLDRQTSLPHGYVDGWTFVSPIIEMPVYLPWLAGRVEDLGGTITRMNLKALPTGRRPGRQLLRAGRPAARGRPVGGAGARPGRVRRADRAEALAGRARGADVRLPAQQRHRRRRHRRRGGVEPHALAGDGRRDPAPRGGAGARAPGREGGPAQGRAAPGPPRGTPGAGRRRHPLLRPRRRRASPSAGAWPTRWSRSAADPAVQQHHQRDADQQARARRRPAAPQSGPSSRPTTAPITTMPSSIEPSRTLRNISPRKIDGEGLGRGVAVLVERHRLGDGVGVDRPVDVGERLRRSPLGRHLLDDRGRQPVGVDHQQHQRLGDVGVEARRARPATGRRGWRG